MSGRVKKHLTMARQIYVKYSIFNIKNFNTESLQIQYLMLHSKVQQEFCIQQKFDFSLIIQYSLKKNSI